MGGMHKAAEQPNEAVQAIAHIYVIFTFLIPALSVLSSLEQWVIWYAIFKMSFGFSVGDIILLVQLAHRTFRRCQKAGEEYNEIACEVHSFHSVLRTLRSEAQRPGSKVFKQDPSSTKELIATADRCKNVLATLDTILAKYEGLKVLEGEAGAGKKLW
jgi:transcriptional regulator with GAF, ATPase, and Fis domain